MAFSAVFYIQLRTICPGVASLIEDWSHCLHTHKDATQTCLWWRHFSIKVSSSQIVLQLVLSCNKNKNIQQQHSNTSIQQNTPNLYILFWTMAFVYRNRDCNIQFSLFNQSTYVFICSVFHAVYRKFHAVSCRLLGSFLGQRRDNLESQWALHKLLCWYIDLKHL